MNGNVMSGNDALMFSCVCVQVFCVGFGKCFVLSVAGLPVGGGGSRLGAPIRKGRFLIIMIFL